MTNHHETYCPAGCITDLSTLDYRDLCFGKDGLTYCRPCFERDRKDERVEARAKLFASRDCICGASWDAIGEAKRNDYRGLARVELDAAEATT